MTSHLEKLCAEKGMRMTGQRRVIAHVMEAPLTIPMSRNCIAVPPRSIRIFRFRPSIAPSICLKKCNIIERHAFRDGRARYEAMPLTHHDHLIDLKSGKVIEFTDPRIEALQEEICRELGFKLVDHRLEFYAVPVRPQKSAKPD